MRKTSETPTAMRHVGPPLLAEAPADRKRDALRLVWEDFDETVSRLEHAPDTIGDVHATLAVALCDNNLVGRDIAAAAMRDTRQTVSDAGTALAERLGESATNEAALQSRYDAIFDRPHNQTQHGPSQLEIISQALVARNLKLDAYAATRIIAGLEDGTISTDRGRADPLENMWQLFEEFRVTSDAIAIFANNPATHHIIDEHANCGNIPIRDMIANNFNIEVFHLTTVCGLNRRHPDDVAADFEAAMVSLAAQGDLNIDVFSPRWATLELKETTRRQLVAAMTPNVAVAAALATPELLEGSVAVAASIISNDQPAPGTYRCVQSLAGARDNNDVAADIIRAILRDNAQLAGETARGVLNGAWSRQLAVMLWQDGRPTTEIRAIVELMARTDISFADAEAVAQRLG